MGQEITSTTQEANARIQQASDAIRTLKERLGSKHLEHDKLRSDTARLKREAQALEQDNEHLRKCGVTLTGTREDRDVEVKRLQRDVEVLTEQKEALVLILQDLYGAVGDKTPQSLSPQQAELKPKDSEVRRENSPPRVEPLEPASRQQSWTNMLPRPSEL